MLFSTESLKPDVIRRVSMWQRNVVSATETAGALLDRFAFALRDRPEAVSEVAVLLGTVPKPLIMRIFELLESTKVPGRGWHWPPGGPPLTTPLPTPWGWAGVREAAALDLFANLLRDYHASNVH